MAGSEVYDEDERNTEDDAPLLVVKSETTSRSRNSLRVPLLSNVLVGYNMAIISWACEWLQIQHPENAEILSSVISSSLAGCIVGMLLLGYLGDYQGRSQAMLLTLGFVMIGCVGSAVLSWGSYVWEMLGMWRFVLGIGMGGIYPLSAVSASESSAATEGELPLVLDRRTWLQRKLQDKQWRVGLSLSAQLIGAMLAPITVIILAQMEAPAQVSWRVALCLGVIPAIMAIPDAFSAYQAESLFSAAVDADTQADNAVASTSSKCGLWRACRSSELSEGEMAWRLCGTAGSWFLYDVTAFGVSMSMPEITQQVLGRGSVTYEATNTMYVTAVGFPAAFASLILVSDQHWGRKKLQTIGFILAAVSFMLLAWAHNDANTSYLVHLGAYGTMIFTQGFGPSLTTFMLPQESFPSSVRSTMNGISAAAGKLGAVVGAAAFIPMAQMAGLSVTLCFGAIVSVIAAAITSIFVRDLSPSQLEKEPI